MNPFTRDVERRFAGAAHQDAYPNAKRAARLGGHHKTTEHRRRAQGAPFHQWVRDYVRDAQNAWELEAYVAIERLRPAVEAMPERTLVERLNELQIEIVHAYGATLLGDMSGQKSQVDQASADKRLAALLHERAAIRLRVAAERIDLEPTKTWRPGQ